MAAELVAKKLEAKLGPGTTHQSAQLQQQQLFQMLYPISGGGGFTGGNTIPVPASSPAPPTELITGVVTQIEDTFGMISGDVFFLFT